MSSGEQPKRALTAEQARLAEGSAAAAGGDWKLIGPYFAERAWGTVREDYSADGDAWRYFPFDHAQLAGLSLERGRAGGPLRPRDSASVSRSRSGTDATPS